MILYLELDALGQVSSWDLLEEEALARGSSPSEDRVLSSVSFELGIAGKPRRSKYSAQVLTRIGSLAEKGQECFQPSSSVIDELSATVGLDSDEALLCAFVAEIDESLGQSVSADLLAAVGSTFALFVDVPRVRAAIGGHPIQRHAAFTA